MGTIELTSKVRELKEMQQMADELAAMMESIKDELKKEMEARSLDEMTVDVFTLRWKPVTTARFDTKAFQNTHAELYTQYCKSSTTRRFTVA